MAAFAFDVLEAPSLAAICQPDNAASAKVMQRLGMRYRGVELWHQQTVSVYDISAADYAPHAAAQR